MIIIYGNCMVSKKKCANKVALCFSRDQQVCLQLCSKFGAKAQSAARHAPLDIPGQALGAGTAFPPSSCIPFYGWAMYGTFLPLYSFIFSML